MRVRGDQYGVYAKLSWRYWVAWFRDQWWMA